MSVTGLRLGHSPLVGQVLALSRRAVLSAARQPTNWIPGIFFPFMLAAVYASQFTKAVDLPEFPFDDITFLDFVLVGGVLQGVLFGAITGGTEMALDIENGFMDRLLASPVSRPAILVGRLAGSMAYAALLATLLMVVFSLMGADIAGGIGAWLVVLVVAALLALALGSIATALALKTGSQEVVQSIFPLVFVTIFASSAFFPVNLMEGWYGEVAAKNPITWIIDPLRRLTVVGFDWADVGRAIGVAAAFAALTFLIAFRQLQRRLATT